MSPLRSRSTIICVMSILAFLAFAEMVLAAGYFDAGFGAAGIMFLSTAMKYAFDHQAKEGGDRGGDEEEPDVVIVKPIEPTK